MRSLTAERADLAVALALALCVGFLAHKLGAAAGPAAIAAAAVLAAAAAGKIAGDVITGLPGLVLGLIANFSATMRRFRWHLMAAFAATLTLLGVRPWELADFALAMGVMVLVTGAIQHCLIAIYRLPGFVLGARIVPQAPRAVAVAAVARDDYGALDRIEGAVNWLFHMALTGLLLAALGIVFLNL